MQASFGRMEETPESIKEVDIKPDSYNPFKVENLTPSEDSSVEERKVPSYYPSMNLHDMIDHDSQRSSNIRKQGTFLGVFLPDVQSIVGIILFVRLPWITGEAGIGMTLLILIICSSATFLTSLSMSAIATNGKIPTGGSYFMIARSLGPGFGGSVGTLYFLGLASSVSMYIIGAMETFIYGSGFQMISFEMDLRFLSLIVLVFLWLINFIGMKYVTQFGIGFLGTLIISIICMYAGIFSAGARSDQLPDDITGLSSDNFADNFYSNYSNGIDFQTLMAIFFPAVTGIMAGSNRSAEIANPSKSIPIGTICAVATTTIGYFSFILLFGAVAKREELIDNLQFVPTISWPTPHLVTASIVFSSIGAALQCLAGAPRILTSIALDEILPLEKAKDFERALYFTSFIAGAIVCIGSLDMVAPIITMFYLLFYGCVNVACGLLSLQSNPSWRPSWPYYHWTTAFAGALLCFTIMVVISWWASLLSFLLAAVLYYSIEIKAQTKNWGDGISGLKQERAKAALLAVDPIKVSHVKNWKPQLLILGYLDELYDPKNPGLIALADQLKKGNGLTIFGACLVGEKSRENFNKTIEARNKLYEYFRLRRMEVFSKVVLNKTARNGLKSLIQTAGLGGLEPNSVVMAWPENWQTEPVRASRFVKLMEYSAACGHAVLALKPVDSFNLFERLIGTIDIWWFSYDGGLMCLLAFLLKKHRVWKLCDVRLFYVITAGDEKLQEEMPGRIEAWVKKYRVFSNVSVDVVTIPSEALMQHHFRAFENQNRSEESGTGVRSSIEVLNEIEFSEMELARNMFEKERQLIEKRLSDVGLSRKLEDQEDDGVVINERILDYSKNADLVITGLPAKIPSQTAEEYLRFCENMTRGLQKVLFVRGTEKSVVSD